MKERTEKQSSGADRWNGWEPVTVNNNSFFSLMHLFFFFFSKAGLPIQLLLIALGFLVVVLVIYCCITNYSKILIDLRTTILFICYNLAIWAEAGKDGPSLCDGASAGMSWLTVKTLVLRWPHTHGQQTDEDSRLWAQLAYWLGPQFSTQPGYTAGSGFSLHGSHGVIERLTWSLDSPRPQRWMYPSLKV